MKLLINALSARLGGGQTYLRNLLLRFPQAEGWHAFLLCPDNFDTKDLPANVERIFLQQNLNNPFRRAYWERRYLPDLCKKLNADLLFSPGGMLPFAKLPAGLKTAVTFQNMLPFDMQQRKRYPFGYRRLRDWLLERSLSSAMLRADLVIFISEYAKTFITKKYGDLSALTPVIPHGVSPAFFDQSRSMAGRDSYTYLLSDTYFLYVSFIDHYKSQIEVVRAYALVKERTGTKAKLLLAGAENRQYGDLLRAEIAHLGLGESVAIVGNLPHSDLPLLYQNAAINLFASCTENCPNILLEMMASGRPALVSNRGPMPEFSGDAVTYFDPANVMELADRWIAMLNAPERAAELAAKARLVAASFSWDQAANLTWQAVAKAVTGHP